MPRLRIHPLFIALSALMLLTDNMIILINMITAVIMHELAHSRVARSRGYVISEMVLMPYGAVLSGKENISKADAVAIYIAGPLFNGAIALILVSLWWLIPPLYHITIIFTGANIALCLFNLLPLYPLDGAKILLNVTKNKIRTLKILKLSGIILSVLLFAAFIVSAFYQIHFSLGIMSIFLFAGAVIGSEGEKYHHIAMNAPFKKNLSDGMKSENILIPLHTPLIKVLRHIKPDKIVTFTVIDKNMNKIKDITESEMREIFESNDILTTVGKAIKNANGD